MEIGNTNPSKQTEKEIIKDHLDEVVNRYINHERDVDALPYFIKQFKEEITDSWSALDILNYLKDNDFQIL